MDIHSTNCGIYSSVCPAYALNCAFAGTQNLDWYTTAQEKEFPDNAPN